MDQTIAGIIAGRTRKEWEAVFDELDACVTPVLTPDEAAVYPHAKARKIFDKVADVMQPMPAPRFSRTPSKISGPPPSADTPLDQIMSEWCDR